MYLTRKNEVSKSRLSKVRTQTGQTHMLTDTQTDATKHNYRGNAGSLCRVMQVSSWRWCITTNQCWRTITLRSPLNYCRATELTYFAIYPSNHIRRCAELSSKWYPALSICQNDFISSRYSEYQMHQLQSTRLSLLQRLNSACQVRLLRLVTLFPSGVTDNK